MKSKLEIKTQRGITILNLEIMLGLGIGIPRISSGLGFSGSIGDTYQGGIIFHLDGSGGGLIAAPANETKSIWGCQGVTITGADGTAIGTGAQNTIDILAECLTANTAADRCRDKDDGTYSDWFLPSKDELNKMYVNLHTAGLGSFTAASYWCSSEYSSTNAWGQHFATGSQFSSSVKSGGATLYVRAIRAF